MKINSPTGEMIRIHYKVSIPLGKIKRANNESTDVKNLSQKYIEIFTRDNFDFWFMGFLNYQKTFKHLDQAISQTQRGTNSYIYIYMRLKTEKHAMLSASMHVEMVTRAHSR